MDNENLNTAIPPVAIPATPAHGGSYTLDDTTGEHILIERTQEQIQ